MIQRSIGTDTTISVQFKSPVEVPPVEVVERKGWGHPDKLADDLAEALSREYSRYCLRELGAVLHHNFDKLCLLGGGSEVRYGVGKMTKPIRVLVNGRVSNGVSGSLLDTTPFIIDTCEAFFRERLPLLDVESSLKIELNLSTSSSPGRVITDEHNDRNFWFEPRSIHDLPERKRLHANDTSLGTGYAPLSPLERMVIELVDHLSAVRSSRPDWMGTDVKMMAFRSANRVDITTCIPQIAAFVRSKDEYRANIESVTAILRDAVGSYFPAAEVSLSINARDKLASDELYLTAIGSSIESGDEGVVGRGNRVNGLITPMRAMNVEGANGKNPIYHVGKIYNVVANRLAADLHQKFGGTFVVNLVSKTGADLVRPWQIIVQTTLPEADVDEIERTIMDQCDRIPEVSREIIENGLMLS